MSKLKIEHGVSRVKRAKLQTYIDQTIADDIALMADSTNNEQNYIVNELLRFALSQSEEFQMLKAQRGPKGSRILGDAKPLPLRSTIIPDQVLPLSKSSPVIAAKPGTTATEMTRQE